MINWWNEPAISKTLRAAERKSGLPLIQRQGRRLRLTSAGCDLALHCTGRLDEMREVAAAAGPLSAAAAKRVARLPKPFPPPPGIDVAAAEAHLNALMAVA